MGQPITPLHERSGYIWCDGEWLNWRDASTHLLSHSLHYGTGAFEGLRAYKAEGGSAIFRLDDHTARLFESAKAIGIDIPWSVEELNRVQLEVVVRNELEQAYIRPLVFLGSEALGLRAEGLSVRVMVAAWDWPAYIDPETVARGLHLKVSSYRRSSVDSGMSRAKVTGGYLASIMALREALSAGADEALMLDSDGYVAEGTGENVFIVNGRSLITPPAIACLDGITRRSIIELAEALGFEVREQHITREMVYAADEVFLTGTAVEVVGVRQVDHVAIGNGKVGDITQLFRQRYLAAVTDAPEYQHWRSPCQISVNKI